MAKNDTQEIETADAGDAPLIDLNDASIKKMVARAKKRGVVTYEELNEALEEQQRLIEAQRGFRRRLASLAGTD